VQAATPDAWIAPVGGITALDQALTNSTAASEFVFSTGYQYIGLNTAVWTNLCNALNNFY
jgi:hypothetical protein